MEEKTFYNDFGIEVTNLIIDSPEWIIPLNEVKRVKCGLTFSRKIRGWLSMYGCFFFVTEFFKNSELSRSLGLQWWSLIFWGFIIFVFNCWDINSSYRITLYVEPRRKLILRGDNGMWGEKKHKPLKQAIKAAIVENLENRQNTIN